ncbi:hypothetical protein KPL78_29605 [Roseomonas sp. HJA6]|uniref:Uncharacterized protein n=1 Tax=Roseomonas alba TaxID=2846776 RepID=A0ABS7AI88_9PROT|nr:hypothetical protein [Neoroseomonas alba]MBW6402039.1 hypothetical protein [Neoroseomonas alba]
MANLTANRNLPERLGNRFGYPVAAGARIFRGALMALTAAGLVVRPGDAGAAVVVGLSPTEADNRDGADGAIVLEPKHGTFPMTVPGAVHTNIGDPVYCTDDNTLTLTASTNLKVGKLAGIEAGQTFVEV